MPPGRLGLSGLFFILLFATGSPVRAHGLPFHAGSALTAGFQENAARTFVGLMGRSGRVGTPLGSVRRQVDVFMVGGGGLGFETSGIGDPIVDTKWIFHRRDRPGGTRRIRGRRRLQLRRGPGAPLPAVDARAHPASDAGGVPGAERGCEREGPGGRTAESGFRRTCPLSEPGPPVGPLSLAPPGGLRPGAGASP